METKSETVKYVNTVKMLCSHENFEKPLMCGVVFAVKDDSTVHVTVESRSCNQIKACGTKIITREELSDAPEDQYDNLVFAAWAFKLIGLNAGIVR